MTRPSVEALTTSHGLVQMSIERGGTTVAFASRFGLDHGRRRQYSSTGLGTHVDTLVPLIKEQGAS